MLNHPGVQWLSVPWKIIGIGRWLLKHRSKWEMTTQEGWKDELQKQQGKVKKNDCICVTAADPLHTGGMRAKVHQTHLQGNGGL